MKISPVPITEDQHVKAELLFQFSVTLGIGENWPKCYHAPSQVHSNTTDHRHPPVEPDQVSESFSTQCLQLSPQTEWS